MVARVTLAEIDAVRTRVEDAVQLFEDSVVPALSEQDGYEGVYVLVTWRARPGDDCSGRTRKQPSPVFPAGTTHASSKSSPRSLGAARPRDVRRRRG